MRRVVITGLGMVSPVGLTMEESWKRAVQGNSGIGTISHIDSSRLAVKIAGEVKGFDPNQYMDAKEAKKSTRFIQLAVAASKEALADSGIDLEKMSERIGCSVGVGLGSLDFLEQIALLCNEKGPSRISPFFIPYVINNMAAGLVANTFKLKGPNLCPTTACTSGTHGIGEAYLHIKNNYADAMVCGGAEAPICEISIGAFANMKALSRRNDAPEKASRPFDRDRDGFVMGEGSGILVLEEYESAKKRGAQIYAELVGYGMTADAYHITSPAPGGEGARRCMDMALLQGQIAKERVGYINAHGTSTLYNDWYETDAIKKVFADHAEKIMISSTKGVTGHCLGAAGGIEGAFLAKAIREGVLPPTANFEQGDEHCTLDYIPNDARNVRIDVGLSNSFGFGGTNATIAMAALK